MGLIASEIHFDINELVSSNAFLPSKRETNFCRRIFCAMLAEALQANLSSDYCYVPFYFFSYDNIFIFCIF